jgi:hypothetical protein
VFVFKKTLFREEFVIVKLSVKNISLREGLLNKILLYMGILDKKKKRICDID